MGKTEIVPGAVSSEGYLFNNSHKYAKLYDELYLLNKDRIKFKELPGYFANGSTGLYFIFTVDFPKQLIYNSDDWN